MGGIPFQVAPAWPDQPPPPFSSDPPPTEAVSQDRQPTFPISSLDRVRSSFWLTVIQMVETDDDASTSSSSSPTSPSRSALARSFRGLFSRSSVSLSIDCPLVYVTPRAPSSSSSSRHAHATSSEAAADAVVSGTVVLTPSSGRPFGTVCVSLVGRSSLTFPSSAGGHSESSTFLHRTLRFLVPKEPRDSGRLTFRWRFVVPHDAAPSVHDEEFGNVAYKIEATATAEGVWNDVAAEEPFRVVATPQGDPLDTLPFDYYLEAVSEDLGPYRLSMSSSALTIGGTLSSHLRFGSLPSSITLLKLQHHLLPLTGLRSSHPSVGHVAVQRPKARCESLGPDIVRGAAREGEEVREKEVVLPMQLGASSGPWDFSQTLRLPGHDRLPPSTLDHSSSPLETSYMWCLEVVYSSPDRPKRVLAIKKPVRVISCLCTPESVLLPAYSPSDPHFEASSPTVSPTSPHCACSFNTDASGPLPTNPASTPAPEPQPTEAQMELARALADKIRRERARMAKGGPQR